MKSIFNILNEGLTNDIIKGTLSRVLNVSRDDIVVKRRSSSEGWITVPGYTKKLRFAGDNLYVGNLGFNIDNDLQMDYLADEMSKYKETSLVEEDKIDYKNMEPDEIKAWLDKHNDCRDYEDDSEFKKFWLEVYKYYHHEVLGEAEMVPREAGEIDPERRADLVARLKKFWPRCPHSWINARTDDYLEQVVTGYENREKQKQEMAKKREEERKAAEEQAKKDAFKARLNNFLTKKGE